MAINALEEELFNVRKDKKLLIKMISWTDDVDKKQEYVDSITKLSVRERELLAELMR